MHERNSVALNAFGALDGEFQLPTTGAVGQYRFTLSADEAASAKREVLSWEPLRILVSDFVPAPFAIATSFNGDEFRFKANVRVSTQARFHAGGPYADADIRVTARLQPAIFHTDNPLAAGFHFSHHGAPIGELALLDRQARIDRHGNHDIEFTLPETDIAFGTLQLEAAIRDDRGKFVAGNARATYAGSDHFVGLKRTRWLHREHEKARIAAIAVDRAGTIADNAAVAVIVKRREIHSARVKGPGSAYLTEYAMRWVTVAACQIRIVAAPGMCEFTPRTSGYYEVVATTIDGRGRTHQSALPLWVTGSGFVAWDHSEDATLSIVAEKSSYEIGETARYLVKNPFPGATALVSVERYGVLDHWIETFDTSTPVIEVPIKPDYLPGFYLSVMVVSPRVTRPPDAGRVDLGKPSYRLGYVENRVRDPFKQLSVDVTTDFTHLQTGADRERDRYRETARGRGRGTRRDCRRGSGRSRIGAAARGPRAIRPVRRIQSPRPTGCE